MGKKKASALSKNKITPETKRILVDAVDKALGSIGFPPIDEARATLRNTTSKNLADADFKTVFYSSVMVALLGYIDDMAEPTPQELKEILAKVETFPFEFRSALDNMTKSVKQNLPRRPGGGRRSSLTIEQKKVACVKVGTLMGQGVKFRDALIRVARQFGVGPRTIQRAWQERRQLYREDE